MTNIQAQLKMAILGVLEDEDDATKVMCYLTLCQNIFASLLPVYEDIQKAPSLLKDKLEPAHWQNLVVMTDTLKYFKRRQKQKK